MTTASYAVVGKYGGTLQTASWWPEVGNVQLYFGVEAPIKWKADLTGYEPAFKSITGPIFEFGFSDSIMQMWAAFLYELVHGKPLKKGEEEERAVKELEAQFVKLPRPIDPPSLIPKPTGRPQLRPRHRIIPPSCTALWPKGKL